MLDKAAEDEEKRKKEEERKLSEAAKKERERKEDKFLNLCEEGDVESVKALLAEDPSLINSKDEYGKS